MFNLDDFHEMERRTMGLDAGYLHVADVGIAHCTTEPQY
jgi:hypothetical protein